MEKNISIRQINGEFEFELLFSFCKQKLAFLKTMLAELRDYRFKFTKSIEKTKMKVPKVSFITKSEVLRLDDGYKWRKYGQKPVKDSPFPR